MARHSTCTPLPTHPASALTSPRPTMKGYPASKYVTRRDFPFKMFVRGLTLITLRSTTTYYALGLTAASSPHRLDSRACGLTSITRGFLLSVFFFFALLWSLYPHASSIGPSWVGSRPFTSLDVGFNPTLLYLYNHMVCARSPLPLTTNLDRKSTSLLWIDEKYSPST